MRALVFSTVAMGLLHLGCEATLTPASDVPSSPDVEVSVAIDVGFDDDLDAGFDAIAPTPDRGQPDVLAVDIAMGVDVAPDVPRIVDVVADNGRCPVGEARCGTACVAFVTDPMNCGGCGQACTARQSCIRGSCIGEQRSCPGAGGRGCGLVEVTGGTFAQGDATLPDFTYAAPVQPSITVSDFAIDAYEVTVGRFRRFWDAGHPDLPGDVAYPGGPVPWFRGKHDVVTEPGTNQADGCDWSRVPMGRELLPLVCLDIATAQCFCVWDGGRLPTESEWEYVARAWPIEGLPSPRAYPWGNELAGAECVVAQFGIVCEGETTLGYRFLQVGSLPPIGGIYDLAGNVSEYTASGFIEYAAPSSWGGRPRVDPFSAASRSGGFFVNVIRGGRFQELNYAMVHGAARGRVPASASGGGLGFRCVRSRRRP